MVGFENHSVLGDFARAQAQEPMPLKVQHGRTVYQSHRDFVLFLEGEEKEKFLSFVRKMLQWLPEKRMSAQQLLDDPWLQPDLS